MTHLAHASDADVANPIAASITKTAELDILHKNDSRTSWEGRRAELPTRLPHPLFLGARWRYLAAAQPQPVPQLQLPWHLHRSPQVQRSALTLAHPHERFSQLQGL
jgi:hypothetical protein